MAYFENERQMYIPLSVDEIDVSKQNYFFSNKKVIEMVIALVPYIVFLYFMLQIGSRVFPMLIFTGIYLFLYSYFFRFRILEENRLKKMLIELDNNRYSGVDHFWGINKIGDEDEFDGLIHYEKNSNKNVRAYVVYFDRGSTIGVEKGNYTNFRITKQEFLRRLAEKRYDFQWYEIPKRRTLPPSLVSYFNTMTKMENEVHKKLLKLQIDINTWFITDADELYVDYIVVKCNRASDLFGFRRNLEDIIQSTLYANNYIVNPRILNKKEVEQFFEDVLLIKSLDSDHIYKGQDSIPFEKFGTVIRVIGQDEREISIDELNDYDFSDTGGNSLEKIIEKDELEKERKIKIINKKREMELKQLKQKRLRDTISDREYKENMAEINANYDQEITEVENGLDIIKRNEEIEKIGNKRKEKEAEILRKKQEAEQKKLEPKFVEINEDIHISTREEVIQKIEETEHKKYLETHADDYLYDDDLSLEDLLDGESLEDIKKEQTDISQTQVNESYIEKLKLNSNPNYIDESDILEVKDSDDDISLEDLLDED